MEIDPLVLGTTARAWDEQHLDLQAASRQVGGADAGGFTSAVSGTAARFATTWGRFAGTLADRCEAQADGLRTTIEEALAADDTSAFELALIRAATRELR